MGFEGGNATPDVISEMPGPNYVKKKHLGQIKYEDLILKVDASMSKVFYQWVKDTVEQRYLRKNGAIIVADYNYRELSRIEFFNGLISEVTFPALDATSRDRTYLQVKITPATTRFTRAGSTAQGKPYTATAAQTHKLWLPSNYRLKIDGLDNATPWTHKISALTFKMPVVAAKIGDRPDSSRVPAGFEVSNLTAWVASSHSESLYQWFENFVIRGNSADNMEKSGTLEYFDPTLKEVLFRLTFDHLGIFKLSSEMPVSGSSTLPQDKAEMYVENIRFDFSAPW